MGEMVKLIKLGEPDEYLRVLDCVTWEEAARVFEGASRVSARYSASGWIYHERGPVHLSMSLVPAGDIERPERPRDSAVVGMLAAALGLEYGATAEELLAAVEALRQAAPSRLWLEGEEIPLESGTLSVTAPDPAGGTVSTYDVWSSDGRHRVLEAAPEAPGGFVQDAIEEGGEE